MKTNMVMETLKQYPSESLVFVRITLGTSYAIDKCAINASHHDDSLFEVRGIERDEKTGAPVLLLRPSE